jgi:transcriptional regulator with XRE-family HTH domain
MLHTSSGFATVFCEELQMARRNSGHNQKDFALSLGVDRSQYNKYEKGRHTPDIDQADRILRALGKRLVILPL